MTDNTTLPTGGGGDTIRTLDRTGTGTPKTEVVQLDVGGTNQSTESLVSSGNPLPVQGANDQIRVALAIQAAAAIAAQPQNGFVPLELSAFLASLNNPIPYPYYRTREEIAAGVIPTNIQYPPWDLRRLANADVLGRFFFRAIDDTQALQNAYLIGGEWKIPAGAQVRVTGTIVGVKATRLYSDSPVSPEPSDTIQATQVYLVHDFNGTFFDLQGTASDDKAGAGFAFENLTFLNINGDGTGASGTCIKSYAATYNRCPWVRVSHCNIENQTSHNCFTWGIDLDGTAAAVPNNNRDCLLDDIRIASDASTAGSIRLSGMTNMFLSRIQANLANGNLVLTGTDATHLCQSIFIMGSSFNGIVIDWCSGIYGAGNATSTLTATANTSDVSLGCDTTTSISVASAVRCTIFGKETTGKFTVRSTGDVRYEMGTGVVGSSGILNSDTALQAGTNPASAGIVRLPNGYPGGIISARNAANTGNISIVVVDGANRVQLVPDGATMLWGTPPAALGGGAAATLGTIGGSGPATAAQNEWLKIVDSNGLTRWIPVWA